MRHAEMLELAKAMDEACFSFWEGSPTQLERLDGLALVWQVTWNPAHLSDKRRLRAWVRVEYPGAGARLDLQDNLPPALVARREEIAEQLLRWERNEADWPLARKEQP